MIDTNLLDISLKIMKKLICILCILLVGTFAFSYPIFQFDISDGLLSTINTNPDNSQKKFEFMGASSPCVNTAFLWEFDTEAERKNHYFFGFDTGLQVEVEGFSFSSIGGLSSTLFDNGENCMELCPSIQIGTFIDLSKDFQPYLYTRFNLDLIHMDNSRQGIYGGLGITNHLISMFYRSKNDKFAFYGTDNFCIKIIVGYKV